MATERVLFRVKVDIASCVCEFQTYRICFSNRVLSSFLINYAMSMI